MSEIKSSMEKVMERLAAMDAKGADRADTGLAEEELVREGMRRAAAYLNGEQLDLAADLTAAPPEKQAALRRGMFQTLARNIFLPRDEEQLGPAERAMAGMVALAGGSGELLRFLGELKKVLEQYLNHQKQLRQQLAEQFAQEMARLEGQLAAQTGMSPNLRPEQHPKFQEEWQRVLDELNSQYGRALEQYKEQIRQFLGA
ncbi:DUF6657 family protein [Desulfurivibrio alkaliphilus]|uniref:Uncharacterized protein n=1 Tax=Desulfurivibrio alkaliphilus (strain DSM 19089 / UNIQEM U267 / AHT2) TaxID=589865 RepID=D6Z4X2_DESAT|nr:DUF6657 family protein [Desulfurivibrio alkaliphilus]ADH86597.1 conserved hypothetical protein [Desulfurivibrio alkaliphilus AHT 2]